MLLPSPTLQSVVTTIASWCFSHRIHHFYKVITECRHHHCQGNVADIRQMYELSIDLSIHLKVNLMGK
ncbi:hypothetical protein L2E82_06612 [Cichorium intybus]|uniref:Uncharacterized protein n=1 Tax=Cichorium intybus TaxID=13427 RepID=A0ACB9HAJ9_CICIN|nr:hypothetical protein L2E82_06612 [Cichorium intybus]